MRKLLTVATLFALGLTGCESKKTTTPTSFAPQPNVSAGGAPAGGQPNSGAKKGPETQGAAKVEP